MGTKNRKIALERFDRLFQLAKNTIHGDEELAQRYTTLARAISKVSRVRVPTEYKRLICRKCKRLILAGINCRVRIRQRREPHVVVTCGYCGKHMRFPTKRGEKQNRDTTENEKNKTCNERREA